MLSPRSIRIWTAVYVFITGFMVVFWGANSHASNISSPWQLSQQNPGLQCEFAAEWAERKHGLPRMLLLAIGMTESGRWNAETRSGSPWPWTVTSGGPGSYFPDQASALQHVAQLRAQGTTNIDIGCFQINQHFHPNAFESTEAGFDPFINADYAARFLKDLRNEHRTWERAVAIYHSKTPSRGTAYRQKVYQRLNDLHVAEQKHRQEMYTHMSRFRQMRHNFLLARRNYNKANGFERVNYNVKVFANNAHITEALF